MFLNTVSMQKSCKMQEKMKNSFKTLIINRKIRIEVRVRWRPWPPRRRCREAWETGSKRDMQTSAAETQVCNLPQPKQSVKSLGIGVRPWRVSWNVSWCNAAQPWTYKTRFTESYTIEHVGVNTAPKHNKLSTKFSSFWKSSDWL